MNSEYYRDQLWNLSGSNTLCRMMPALELAAVLPLTVDQKMVSKETGWQFGAEIELVLLLSLASDGLW